MGRAIRSQTFHMPPEKQLPRSSVTVPHVIVGDEAFPLLPNVMKPYPRPQGVADITNAIFNYRLSRARRVSENAFGICSQNFRIYYTPIHLDYDALEELVYSACILHKILMNETSASEMDHRRDLISVDNQIVDETISNVSIATTIRDNFKNYFMSEGSVDWQDSTARM